MFFHICVCFPLYEDKFALLLLTIHFYHQPLCSELWWPDSQKNTHWRAYDSEEKTYITQVHPGVEPDISSSCYNSALGIWGDLIGSSRSPRTSCYKFSFLRPVLKRVSDFQQVSDVFIMFSWTRLAFLNEISIKSVNFQLHILSDTMAFHWKI